MNIAIVGMGNMGRIVKNMALQNPEIKEVYNIEPALGDKLWHLEEGRNIAVDVNVVIDFSHPDALGDICDYVAAKKGRVGVVFATTGFSEKDNEKIAGLAQLAPVIKSSNFSYGVNSFKKIIDCSASILESKADIEIIEKHHNLKVDAPSGTAISIADIIDPERKKPRIYGRSGENKRKNEIGIHSVRGGTIFGEHTVIFAMKDEVIEIKHTAFSKDIFAKGAIEAALWLCGKEPGYYSIDQVFY